MLILSGTLRQIGDLLIKDKTGDGQKSFKKLWIEHETPGRENQPGDLRIEEILIPAATGTNYPKSGETVRVAVRAYPSGRDIKFQALELLSGLTGSEKPARPLESK